MTDSQKNAITGMNGEFTCLNIFQADSGDLQTITENLINDKIEHCVDFRVFACTERHNF